MKYALGLIVIAVLWFVFYSPSNKWHLVNSEPRGKTIVAFGDSLTEGYGAASGESYPARLSILVGEDVINAGVSGNTTTQALRRVQSDVIDHQPRMVLITLGGNDMIQKLPIEESINSLRSIFATVQASGALVIYGAIDPPLVRQDRLKQIRELCKEMGVLYVPDVMDELWNDTKKMSDTIHPNGEGYKVMAERFHLAIKEYL